jgi:hypothetical protein
MNTPGKMNDWNGMYTDFEHGLYDMRVDGVFVGSSSINGMNTFRMSSHSCPN